MKLTKSKFESLLDQAKYQFVLKGKGSIYFITLSGNTCCTQDSFVAHNETTKKVEIVDYKDIEQAIVDGKEYIFK